MSGLKQLTSALVLLSVVSGLSPAIAAAQDADTREVQSYVLTDAALSKYAQATRKLAALPASAADCQDDDPESASLSDMTARLDAAPGAKNAIQSAGMTTHEYVVFSMSLLHNGLAAWAAGQPGGKLPPGISKANVDFINRHKAELDKLGELRKGNDCADADESEDSQE